MRRVDSPYTARIAIRGLRPAGAGFQRRSWHTHVSWLVDATDQPVGHTHRHRVTDQLPTRAVACPRLCGCGPAALESLESLGVLDRTSHDTSTRCGIRYPDRGRGRNADLGPAFNRRYRIAGPTNAGQSFGPIETEGVAAACSLIGLTGIVGKQDAPGIVMTGRDQEHPVATLRYSREPRIHHAVGPPKSQSFELMCQVMHRLAFVEDEHVAYVFQDQPFDVSTLE